MSDSGLEEVMDFAEKMLDPHDVRGKVQRLLLEEVKTGRLGWYYISSARQKEDGGFQGGFLLEARGPTEAWTLYHRLGFHTAGAETETHGPIPEAAMERIPEEQRWRRLNREEATNLGKP